MRFIPRAGAWIDQAPGDTWGRFPNVLVKKERVDSFDFDSSGDQHKQGLDRVVTWVEPDGTHRRMNIRPYFHPIGAADVTLGTLAYDATTGKATYTPTLEGRAIKWNGSLCGAGELAEDVAGFLFTDYFDTYSGDPEQLEGNRVLKISEGDFLYVVWEGDFEADANGAVTAGVQLKTAASGEVAPSVTPPTSVAEIIDNVTGQMWGKGVATARQTIGGAGLLKVHVSLPRQYEVPS